MKKIQVGEFEFRIIEEEELGCHHLWKAYFEYVTVNPNQEYLIGYGRIPVSVPVKVGRECCHCGLIEREDDS